MSISRRASVRRTAPLRRGTNNPKANPHTGRLHQSTAESNFATLVKLARDAGLIEDVRGLDRGDPQERFRLDVYGSPEVEELLEQVESYYRVDPVLQDRCKKIRQSRIHVSDYLADFSWTSRDVAWGRLGDRIVADVKGWRDPRRNPQYRVFCLKKALVLACFGIEIEERDGRGTRLK